MCTCLGPLCTPVALLAGRLQVARRQFASGACWMAPAARHLASRPHHPLPTASTLLPAHGLLTCSQLISELPILVRRASVATWPAAGQRGQYVTAHQLMQSLPQLLVSLKQQAAAQAAAAPRCRAHTALHSTIRCGVTTASVQNTCHAAGRPGQMARTASIANSHSPQAYVSPWASLHVWSLSGASMPKKRMRVPPGSVSVSPSAMRVGTPLNTGGLL